jgi:hypothetical protein
MQSIDVDALFQDVFKGGKTEADFMATVDSLEPWCVANGRTDDLDGARERHGVHACTDQSIEASTRLARAANRPPYIHPPTPTYPPPPFHARLKPDILDFLIAKISGFGKEREPALGLLTQMDPAFIRRKLPDMLQPVINMCTDTSKKVR